VTARALSLVSSPTARPSRGARAALLAQATALRAQADAIEALAGELAEDVPSAAASAAPELVGRQGVARALGVSLATIDRLDREGQPYVRVGDAKKYDVAAVVTWHRQRTEAEPRRPAPSPAAPRPPQLEDAPFASAVVSGVRRVSVGGSRSR
jgi:hypothetical protein